jgi:glutamate-5-semialdehyde dehydrogenase
VKNMEKKEIRKQISGLRKELSSAQLREDSLHICEQVMSLDAYRRADTVYVYIDCKGEVSTRPLIEAAWRDGKKVAAPRVSGKDMVFGYIRSYEDLAPGSFGIPEPAVIEQAEDEHALLIVPGVAFDSERHRCGYGGGFYDRYLMTHTGHTTVALAFEFQMVEQIPSEVHDICPMYLVTERRMFADPEVLLEQIGQNARRTEPVLRKLSGADKNKVLNAAAQALCDQKDAILAANAADLENGRANGMPDALLDRLMLNEKRIDSMAEGLRQVAALEDPIGEIRDMKRRPNGLMIGRKSVPLGVIGMIYEARPNVTADAFALCFKTGNAVILKGGSDALRSNTAIVKVLRSALAACDVPEDALQLIPVTDRRTTTRFMQLKQYVDVLIPRGGAGLIRSVVENSTVPVIETGTGNCHIYVDETADLEMAVNIVENAKTQRIGVCNACESLVVHEKVVREFLPMLQKRLQRYPVELRCDEQALACASQAVAAREEDWGTEYLDYILSIRTVASLDEAIAHINRYNTGHSEAIITSNYDHAMRFLDEIDAAAVYVNASTRFSDGFEFGFGAEIGISTQRLHARGPMGLEALTTSKFVILGNGQVRP